MVRFRTGKIGWMEKLLVNYKHYRDSIEEDEKLAKHVYGVSGIDYGKEPSGSNGSMSSTTESQFIRKTAIEERIDSYKMNVMMIESGLNRLNVLERNIILNYYVYDESWGTISHKVNMSERQCQRVRDRGLKLMVEAVTGLRASNP